MSEQGIEARFAGRIGGFTLDVAFSLPPTGLTALIGPSGSGKSTVLRCLAGLNRLPGRLLVDGKRWQDQKVFLPTWQRPIGMVFQDAGLLSHLSVTDNLMFGARRNRHTAQVSFEEMTDLLGLEPLLTRTVTHLSGGERQRVAIGRALLSHPELLLMDEPMSSLDAASKAEIIPYLERLHRVLQIPVLYVSHDVSEIARLADRRLHLEGGRIVEAPVARDSLDGLDEGQIRRLALAALRAGLDVAP